MFKTGRRVGLVILETVVMPVPHPDRSSARRAASPAAMSARVPSGPGEGLSSDDTVRFHTCAAVRADDLMLGKPDPLTVSAYHLAHECRCHRSSPRSARIVVPNFALIGGIPHNLVQRPLE